ncbi:MAG: hypothetical protein GXC75_15715 [Xanthomonadaceae bacterium]|nr:hypothetical protein [Xanthomonadaceae bacterium]
MGDFFKWFGSVAFGMGVLALASYWASRLMPIPAGDAEALALVEAPRPTTGRNGFAALWSLKYDIPVADAERLLAAEVSRFEAMPVWTGEDGAPLFDSALDGYPLLAPEGGDKELCGAQEVRCLQHVRARMEAIAPIVSSRAALTARIAALDGYAHFRTTFPPRPDMPFPSYQALFQSRNAHAYAFVRGDRLEGLRGVCRDASIARKLVASGDNLIGGVLGAALMTASARLFAEMLAELPADQPLPEACAGAFAADGAMAAGICTTMIGEGKYALGTFRALNAAGQPWHSKLKAELFLDQQKTMAKGAHRHAWFCSPQAEALVRADVPLDRRAPVRGGWDFSCVANAAGCVLENVAAPSLAGYAERFQDTEARLRMLAAWRWLGAQGNDARPLAERLDEWQASHTAGREIRVSASGDGLEIDLFDDRQERVFALPMPKGWRDSQAR